MLALSTCMWEPRRETGKFYCSAWAGGHIQSAALGSGLLLRLLPGQRCRAVSADLARSQPAGRKTKEKGHVRLPKGGGERQGRKKKRSATWSLFSLSARALLGAVVPAEERHPCCPRPHTTGALPPSCVSLLLARSHQYLHYDCMPASCLALQAGFRRLWCTKSGQKEVFQMCKDIYIYFLH